MKIDEREYNSEIIALPSIKYINNNKMIVLLIYSFVQILQETRNKQPTTLY